MTEQEAKVREEFESAIEQAYWDFKDDPQFSGLSERDRFKMAMRKIAHTSPQITALVEAAKKIQNQNVPRNIYAGEIEAILLAWNIETKRIIDEALQPFTGSKENG